MPKVTESQVRALKYLRDSADLLSNYGTLEAVEKHYCGLPLLKAEFAPRLKDGGVVETRATDRFLSPYVMLKFATKFWIRCIESDPSREQTKRFRWRLTEAGKRACWEKNPPDGNSETPTIAV